MNKFDAKKLRPVFARNIGLLPRALLGFAGELYIFAPRSALTNIFNQAARTEFVMTVHFLTSLHQ